MAVGTFGVQVITSFAELQALAPEWRALESACATDLPFQTWEWTTVWWEHLRADGPGVRDSLRVCVVRDESGQVVGIAPLMLTERPSRGPVRFRFLQFIGADPNVTELRSMLCDPLIEGECQEAVLRHLATSAGQWDWIVWEGLRSNTDALDGLSGAPGRAHATSAFLLALPPTWAELRDGLGRNIKESLRKCYNSLKRDGLTYRLQTVERLEEMDSAVEDFFRLHEARANLKGMVQHSDVFETRRARRFLIEFCRRMAERNAVRIFQLWVDDKLVATRIGFVMGDNLYLYYSGWDPDYSQYSVMTTLLAEVIKYAIGRRFVCLNLSTGNDVSKTRWGAREVRFARALQFAPYRHARVMHFVYTCIVGVRNNHVALALVPAFLVRGSRAAAAPIQKRVSKLFLRSGGTFRLGSFVAAAATMIALDLLDGVADGRLNLLPVLAGG